jgi:diguanylate cyclase (GGDEF)-like protein
LRKADFISRVGGDEFAVILPGAGQKEAMSVVKRIYRTFKDHNSLKGAFPFNISIGIATVNDPLTSLKDALNEADLNMYSRKQINKGELQR